MKTYSILYNGEFIDLDPICIEIEKEPLTMGVYTSTYRNVMHIIFNKFMDIYISKGDLVMVRIVDNEGGSENTMQLLATEDIEQDIKVGAIHNCYTYKLSLGNQ